MANTFSLRQGNPRDGLKRFRGTGLQESSAMTAGHTNLPISREPSHEKSQLKHTRECEFRAPARRIRWVGVIALPPTAEFFAVYRANAATLGNIDYTIVEQVERFYGLAEWLLSTIQEYRAALAYELQ